MYQVIRGQFRVPVMPYMKDAIKYACGTLSSFDPVDRTGLSSRHDTFAFELRDRAHQDILVVEDAVDSLCHDQRTDFFLIHRSLLGSTSNSAEIITGKTGEDEEQGEEQ